MAEEITYIPYGLNEISQLDLMTNLANGLPSFMQQYKWLLKPKNQEKFLKAYDDITKNLTGATDSSGRWIINVNNIDIDGMSPKDKEIYEHAAYYIQLQMSLMTPRVKEEEKKNEDLDKFDFIKSFNQLLLNNYYGGNLTLFADSEQGWNALDARGSNGLRGTDKRRERMIEALESYKKGLEGKNFNFEGTPFTDINDANTKILAAIDALKTSGEEDDLKAFSALGLPYRSYFSNGGNDPYTKGNYSGTYLGYNDYLAELKQAKLKAELEKIKAQRANQYDNYKYYQLNLNGTPLNDESSLALIAKINNNQDLDGNDISGLNWLFKLAIQSGRMSNLSKEELAMIPMYSSNPNRLKKIEGVNGIYYDTYGKKLIRPYKKGQLGGISLLDILKLSDPSKLAELQLLAKLKAMNTPINWNDIDEATSNELWAVANDIGAFVDPEAISGTVMALNAARLRDKNRGEGWNWERILDWGTSALGGLPIIGDAMSAYKAGSNLVKIANASARIGSLVAAAFSAANVPEAWDSIKKIVSKGPTSMTTLDIRNITYGLMGFAAGWKTINSVNARSKPQTTKEKSIEIDGKKVVLDEPTVQKVEATHKLSKNTKEASDNIVKMQEVRDAAKKAGIEITDASKVTSGSGVVRGNKYSKSLGLSKSPIQTNTVKTGNTISSSSNKYWMPRVRRNFLNEYSGTIETPKNPLRKGLDWFMGRTSETKILDSLKPSSEVSQKPQETPKVDPKKVREYKAEIENFKKSYGYTDAPSPITGGYGQSGSTLKAGKFTTTIGGEKITFKLSKSELKDILKDGKINEGKVSEIRGRFAKQINELSSKKDINIKEIAKTLKKLKAKGWLKQGGQINPSLDTIIEDFINNNI